MMQRSLLMTIFCLAFAGCKSAAPTPAGTGAREVAIRYFHALAQQDWETAYGHLDPHAQEQMDRAAFENRARVYCSRLGFPLGKAFVRSCDEEDGQAVARLILTDNRGSRKTHFHQGVILRMSAAGWGIVPDENFGRQR